jgi:hypothetical protein
MWSSFKHDLGGVQEDDNQNASFVQSIAASSTTAATTVAASAAVTAGAARARAARAREATAPGSSMPARGIIDIHGLHGVVCGKGQAPQINAVTRLAKCIFCKIQHAAQLSSRKAAVEKQQ